MIPIRNPLALAGFLPLLLPLTATAKSARLEGQRCGREETRLAIAYSKHQLFERRLARRRSVELRNGAVAGITASRGVGVRKAGHIALIDDDGTLVSEANRFDLAGEGVQFRRKKKGVKASGFGGGIDPDRGDRIAIGDDDTEVIDLLFGFRFFGERYGSVFLNSDGNLTFLTADNASTPRSLARFLNGPPRIAPFFDDLDPSVAAGEGGVYVDSRSEFARFTWLEVPEFDTANSNTFQVTLYPSGRVTFAYGGLDAEEGIVGVSPGGADLLDLIDYSEELPLGRRDNAVAERFSLSEQIDDLGVAKVFLQHFRDIYDILVVWADFSVDLDGAFAFSLTLENDTSGIGRGIFDFSELVESSGRFQTYVQMGNLARYPAAPDQRFLGTDSTLSLIGQEAGHRWLAFVNFMDPNAKVSDGLLGRDRAHWSYFHDSDASVMEGNDIRDNGDGTFTTVAATERFSKLDQYIMGLIPPEEVPDFFYVLGEDSSASRESSPAIGDTFSGERVNVSVQDVIAAEGPRVPSWQEAPKTFKMAFLVLGRRGEPVTDASRAQVNSYRKQWKPFFGQGTDGNGKVKTRLKKKRG
jgi:hypothetical protein